ncbi:Ribosome maturation factor RimM [Morella rubra]|uniref:Ribosome maturation factor RimM n=1 Tax=Morella rubra TaxID=262757 RepID=A0A6A1WAV9_9ROSI|nr:Ribosome maturation factor RimM [Morella rubra]
MQRASPLCSPNSLPSFPAYLPTGHALGAPFRNLVSHSVHLPLNRLQNFRLPLPTLHSTATQEARETSMTESDFVEIGYLSSVHGLQGEIRVKASTDFPELRFSKPGIRWLKQRVLGRETVQEVILVEGRGHPGQKGWILRFSGVDTVDQKILVEVYCNFNLYSLGYSIEKKDVHAKQLIGSTLLVKEEDRPELEEGEFYTRDLVGMRVFLKETGEFVGTVGHVYNSGASDLLHVKLDSSLNVLDKTGKPRTAEMVASDHFVWVPFVEVIVPNVDMDRKEIQITPPKGLLELNLRFDERSKKERRQLEWKERKKFQKRLIAAKKKLCEMEQQHVFHGFRFGEKAQRSLLADQIVGVNSKLLQQALQNIEIPSKRWNVTELFRAAEAKLTSTLKISEECYISSASNEKLDANWTFQERGLHLMSEGKLAVVLVVSESEKQGWGSGLDLVESESDGILPHSLLQKFLCEDQGVEEIEDLSSVPLIFVSSARGIEALRNLFSDNDYFGFESQKVWFLEEEKLPVVSNSSEEQKRHEILMKSPWEMLQSPVGSGGVISLLSSHNIPDDLTKLGVEYIEICSSSQRYIGRNSLLLGFVNSREADIGIQISKEVVEDFEGTFDMIFSINLMKKLTSRIDKLQFFAIPKPHSHVEMVEKEWVDVIPSSPNSEEFLSKNVMSVKTQNGKTGKIVPPIEEEISEELDLKIKKYLRGGAANLEVLQDKKLKGQLAYRENLYGKSAKAAAKYEKWLMPSEGGYLEAEGPVEKTWRIKQQDIGQAVDISSARNQYDVVLPAFGPYTMDFASNGEYMAVAGRKGHLAVVDMKNLEVRKEFQGSMFDSANIDVTWLLSELA